MRVFLDECIPVPVAKLLSGFQVETAKSMGWQAISNGALLTLVASEFEVFITADSNIRFQQNLAGFEVAIVELSTNDLRRIRASLDLLQDAIGSAAVGTPIRVEIPYLASPNQGAEPGTL